MSTSAPRPASRSRNRRGEGSLLREDIVRAAARIVAEEGGAQAVTLRSVARAAGISAPSIYAHFPDRDAILLAVVQEAFAELRLRLAAAAAEPEVDAAERLRATCRAYLDFAQDEPQRYQVMFAGIWNAQDARQAAPERHEEIDVLGLDAFAVLVEAVAAGDPTGADPATDATVLWLGLHGLAHLRSTTPLFPWPPDVAEHLIDRLTRSR